MNRKLTFQLSVSMLLSAGSLHALDIGDIVDELWPKGRKDSGGLSFNAPSGSASSGVFDVVTFNVDGLPKIIGGNSNGDMSRIGEILKQKGYDILALQEVFTKTKHDRLLDELNPSVYPYRSNHHRGSRTTFGDGLLRFSRFAFDKSNDVFARKRWDKCAGDLEDYLVDGENPDCLTEKGFSMASTYVNAGFVIDVYNLHQDAGGDGDSLKAKAKNMAQLAEYINAKSAGNVVIVAGDFNLEWGAGKPAEHRVIIESFTAATGLTFACVETTGSLDGCEAKFNKPDHIAYKSNGAYRLQVTALDYELDFVDAGGYDLSDHWPLRAEFAWIKN